MTRWWSWYKITHVDVQIALSSKNILKIYQIFRQRRLTFHKRPFLMSWRWCLHEALPYVHQTNMSWKHTPNPWTKYFQKQIYEFFLISQNYVIFFLQIRSNRTISSINKTIRQITNSTFASFCFVKVLRCKVAFTLRI